LKFKFNWAFYISLANLASSTKENHDDFTRTRRMGHGRQSQHGHVSLSGSYLLTNIRPLGKNNLIVLKFLFFLRILTQSI
jgi:hypothetical protein